MRILAIATVTDMATGLPGLVDHVSHEEVLAIADRAGKRLGNVIKGVVRRL
jgi:purine nucleoside phosphorylase